MNTSPVGKPETQENQDNLTQERLDQYERELLLRLITDNMLDMVILVNSNNEITYVSPSHLKVLGYGPVELLGTSGINYIHPDDRGKFLAGIEEAHLTGLPVKWEYRCRHIDGHYLWLESVGNPLPGRRGYIVNHRDISDRKHSEEALRESEKNYSLLFSSMQEGFAVWETIYDEAGKPLDYRFLNVNPVFEKIMQLKKDDIIGRLLSETMLGLENYWLDNFARVACSGQPYNYEGYYRYLQYYLQTFIFSPGEKLLAALFIDVTRRKTVEKQLEREREWLTVTLGSIGEAVIATDNTGKVLLLNQVASDLLGWPEGKAIGRYMDDLLNEISDMDKSFYTEPLLRASQDYNEINTNDNTISIIRDGERRFLSNSASSIRDIDGQIIGMVMIIRDITEKMKAEAKIERLSYSDKLTGLYNRAYIDRILADEEIISCVPFSLIMGDMDGLKLTNDVFGHHAGDKLLVNIAKVIRGCCRENDIMARWGGDEFLIVLPGTSHEVALRICERITATCAGMKADPIELHIALGTATRNDPEQDIDELFSQAEEDMYGHKIQKSRSVRLAILSQLEKNLWAKTNKNEEDSQRLSDLALKVAANLRIEGNELDNLALLASLHDIGKVSLPEAIVLKTENLEPEEQEIIKKHAEIGYRMAEAIPELRLIADAILAHHENWDGSGYPRGLKGSEIPLIARILHLVEVYDDMTYGGIGSKMDIEPFEAVKELEKGSGIEFDPDVVQAFCAAQKKKSYLK